MTVNGVTSNYAYTYDPMGRLLTVTKDGTLVEEYRYGPNGARSYEMNLLRGISGRSYEYSSEDQVLTTGDLSYKYDVDGFLAIKTVSGATTTYEYATCGELMKVTLPDGKIIEYINDPLGRRIAKKINGILVEKYLWQGLTRLLAIYDADNTLLMRFEYAGTRLPVAMQSGGATYYLSYDQVGSLRLVIDSSGNIIKALDYDSFGNIIQDTDPLFDMPFSFAGGMIDADTGLIRFGFREYSPGIGRWTAKDPLLFLGGDVDLYVYCINDPINLIDPEGLKGKLGFVKLALKEVHRILGGKLPKGKPGKFGSPQRGTPKKGYRLDPPHDNCPNSPESVDHINYWDYTNGKKGKGGVWGAIPIKESLNSIVLELAIASEYLDYLDPFSYISSPDMAPPPGFKEGPFGTWVETTGWGTTPPLSAGNPYSGDLE